MVVLAELACILVECGTLQSDIWVDRLTMVHDPHQTLLIHRLIVRLTVSSLRLLPLFVLTLRNGLRGHNLYKLLKFSVQFVSLLDLIVLLLNFLTSFFIAFFLFRHWNQVLRLMIVDQTECEQSISNYVLVNVRLIDGTEQEFHTILRDFFTIEKPLLCQFCLVLYSLFGKLSFIKRLSLDSQIADALWVPIEQELFQKLHDRVAFHFESWVFALGCQVFKKRRQSDHKLTNKAAESIDAGRLVHVIVTYVVDRHGDGVLLLLTGRDNIDHEHFLKLLDSFLLFKAHTALSPAVLGTRSFFLLSTLLVLEVFTALHL